jgi:zinc protease
MNAYEPDKAGLASLSASMMNESTENFTAEEIQEELRKTASTVNVSAGNSTTTVYISTLKKHLDRTLELAEEILMRPAFVEEDFNRVKMQQLEGLKSNYQDPASVARMVYDRLIYGDEHIYSVDNLGLEETVQRITLDDVRSFYEKYYDPSLAELVVVGDVSQDEINSKLDFLKEWEPKGAEVPDLPEVASAEKTKVYLVDKPGAPQSQVRIGYLTDMTYDATGEYFKAGLMNYVLGGAFNSRINLNLREDKGWTYGARTYFSASDEPGPFTAYAGIKASATDSSVYEFMKEISDYRENGITEDELAFMRNSIGQRDALEYESPNQKAGFLREIVRYDLDESFVDDQSDIINTITKAEIDDLAKEHLQTDEFYILVVGDAASNREKLEALGYEVVAVTEKGDIITEYQEGNEGSEGEEE